MLDEKIYNYKIIHNLEQLTDEEKIKAFLLGYERCPRFYICDCSCSTYFSNEKDFEPIFKLMNEYNLSTKDVMGLYIAYIKKEIHQYTKLHKKTDFVNMLESAFSKFIWEELDDSPRFYTGKFTENDLKDFFVYITKYSDWKFFSVKRKTPRNLPGSIFCSLHI